MEGGVEGGLCWSLALLCSAIRLEQEPPCCPARAGDTEEHSDNAGPAENGLTGPTGNDCVKQPALINTPLFSLTRKADWFQFAQKSQSEWMQQQQRFDCQLCIGFCSF